MPGAGFRKFAPRRLLLVAPGLAGGVLVQLLLHDKGFDLVDLGAIEAVDRELEVGYQPLFLFEGTDRELARDFPIEACQVWREGDIDERGVFGRSIKRRHARLGDERVEELQLVDQVVLEVSGLDRAILALVVSLPGGSDPAVERLRHARAHGYGKVLVLEVREMLLGDMS